MRLAVGKSPDYSAAAPHFWWDGGGVHAPAGGQLVDLFGIGGQGFTDREGILFGSVFEAQHVQVFLRGSDWPLVPKSLARPSISTMDVPPVQQDPSMMIHDTADAKKLNVP